MVQRIMTPTSTSATAPRETALTFVQRLFSRPDLTDLEVHRAIGARLAAERRDCAVDKIISDAQRGHGEALAFLKTVDLPAPTVLGAAVQGSGVPARGGSTEADRMVRLASCLEPSVPVGATMKLAKAFT